MRRGDGKTRMSGIAVSFVPRKGALLWPLRLCMVVSDAMLILLLLILAANIIMWVTT